MSAQSSALRLAGPALAFIAAMLLSGEAHVGRVHYDEATLEQVVSGSSLIVVAEKVGEPEVRTVHTRGRDRTGKPKTVKFQSRVQKYRVLEVLKGEGDLTKEERELITVGSATLASAYHLQLRYELEGVSKSPIYLMYPGSAAPDAKRVILYLDEPLNHVEGETLEDLRPTMLGKVFNGIRCLFATDAIDAVDKVDEVKALVKRQQAPALPTGEAP